MPTPQTITDALAAADTAKAADDQAKADLASAQKLVADAQANLDAKTNAEATSAQALLQAHDKLKGLIDAYYVTGGSV